MSAPRPRQCSVPLFWCHYGATVRRSKSAVSFGERLGTSAMGRSTVAVARCERWSQGEQDSGAGVARAWRGRGAGCWH
eukprot:gene17574-biopygen18899